MIKEAIETIMQGRHLSEDEMMGAMECIMDGEASPALIGVFLQPLR